jgi:hypothetical protein
MLPSEFTRPATFVCKLDAHNRPGSHWIAIKFRDKYSPWYFDSYGLPPTVKSLDDFLGHNTAHFTYNQHQLQNIASDICGQYVCLYTAYICAKHYNMKSFVATFNSTDADSQALRMFRHEFGDVPQMLR